MVRKNPSSCKMENQQRTFSIFKEHIQNISTITQDLTKLFVYFTIITILGTVLFQYLRVLYLKGPMPNLPAYYAEYEELAKKFSESEQGVYESEAPSDNKENHFGQLLPKEYLAETILAHMQPETSETNEQPKTKRQKTTVSNVRDARFEEAMLAVKKAKQLALSGNKKLASKLFQHALALEPEFADALTGYGEFLEDDDNIVQADLLYQRALTYEPSHTTALANRERTIPVVEKLDKNLLSEIDKKKSQLYEYPPHSTALRKAMKEFYYEHIYHTVALEGNTLTIEEIREIINSRNGIAGKSIFEHNEVIGVDEALKYLNNTLLLNPGAITIEQIKGLHKRVIGYVDPVNAGVFRSNQVYVGKHIPPHPNDVPLYMQEFNEWLNSQKALKMHPVEFAAIAHYKLVYIHPFVDGNGRTSRLLMNLILMKSGFPPVSIQVGDRWVYYETLEAANHGDIRPFVRFIARCVSFTLDGYLLAAENLPFYPKLDATTGNIIENVDGS